MAKVLNPLAARLAEYLKLLQALGGCFDRGNEIVALSMATAVRVLVHDTPKSTSLLTHLGMKTRGQVSQHRTS
jgi:hypothetical protein